MLKDEIEKKISIKKKFKSTELTRQTCDIDYETRPMYKANHNKLGSSISNKLNVKV
jgi:hypothetical protein